MPASRLLLGSQARFEADGAHGKLVIKVSEAPLGSQPIDSSDSCSRSRRRAKRYRRLAPRALLSSRLRRRQRPAAHRGFGRQLEHSHKGELQLLDARRSRNSPLLGSKKIKSVAPDDRRAEHRRGCRQRRAADLKNIFAPNFSIYFRFRRPTIRRHSLAEQNETSRRRKTAIWQINLFLCARKSPPYWRSDDRRISPVCINCFRFALGK